HFGVGYRVSNVMSELFRRLGNGLGQVLRLARQASKRVFALRHDCAYVSCNAGNDCCGSRHRRLDLVANVLGFSDDLLQLREHALLNAPDSPRDVILEEVNDAGGCLWSQGFDGWDDRRRLLEHRMKVRHTVRLELFHRSERALEKTFDFLSYLYFR